MSDKKTRRHRRSYLESFTQNDDGSYTYKGICYRRHEPYTPVILWTSIAFAATAASGIFPYAPMMNTFYVILPFLGEIACGGLLLWAVLRVAYHGQVLREYVYEKTAARVNPLSVLTAVFTLAGCVANLVYLILHGFDADALQTIAFFSCRIISAFSVLLARQKAAGIRWEKAAPGKATVLDD